VASVCAYSRSYWGKKLKSKKALERIFKIVVVVVVVVVVVAAAVFGKWENKSKGIQNTVAWKEPAFLNLALPDVLHM
jgi:phage-related holin